jgi:AhpD family alkylhydroperoxidase
MRQKSGRASVRLLEKRGAIMKRAAALGLFAALMASRALAEEQPPEKLSEGPSNAADAIYNDIEKTFGFVPSFFRAVSVQALPGAWEEMKQIQLNTHSAIPQKYKELEGLAIASQIPCAYCVYFHTQTARANGATDAEIQEAIALAGLVRHWSAFLSGTQLDPATFHRDLGRMLAAAHRMDKVEHHGESKQADQSMSFTDALSTYNDVEKTLGFVPTFIRMFPQDGVAGAWKELKSLALNPNTAIPSQYKDLIALGVSATAPCAYCVEYAKEMAKAHGASDPQITEAVAVAGIVRKWSALLNGAQIDQNQFKQDVDRLTAGRETNAT